MARVAEKPVRSAKGAKPTSPAQTLKANEFAISRVTTDVQSGYIACKYVPFLLEGNQPCAPPPSLG
jgi:hypothetical protein